MKLNTKAALLLTALIAQTALADLRANFSKGTKSKTTVVTNAPTNLEKKLRFEAQLAQTLTASQKRKELRMSSAATTTTTTKTLTTATVLITGSPLYKAKIQAALDLLKAKDINNYNLVLSKLKEIREVGGNATYVDVGTRVTYFRMIDAEEVYWAACSIVHETNHIVLYQAGLPYAGTEAELTCIRKQTECAITIGAPAYLISYLKSLDGTHWIK